MRGLIHDHLPAILLTIFVGVVTGLPFLLAPLSLGEASHGMPFLPISDEYHYLANIREVLDGHLSATSVYLYEYKDLPTTWYPVNEWIYAAFAFVFGLIPVVVASKFVLPAALFLLSYILLYYMIGKSDAGKLTAIAGALFVALGAEFVNYSYLLALVRDGIPASVSLWTRLVNPIAGAVQLAGFLVLLWCVWDEKWKYAHVAAGVLLALMVGYIFTFALSLAILGTLFLMALARHKYALARRLFYIGAISIVLDLWWWYAMFSVLGGEGGRVLATQSGMTFTHEPVLNKVLLAASILTAAFFLYARRIAKDRGNDRVWLLITSLLIGGWIALNQQVITGREVWYHHFVQYTVPLSALAVLVSAYLAFSRYAIIWKAAMYLMCLIMMSYSLFAISAYADPGSFDYYKRTVKFAPAFAWIQANSEKDCVVLVNPADEVWQYEEGFLPAFTHCNTYTVWDPLLAKTTERNLHNYLLRMQILGIEPEDAYDHMLKNWGVFRGFFYEEFSQAFADGVDPWVEARAAEVAKEYAEFVTTELDTHIKKYRADFMLSDGPVPDRILSQLPDLAFATSTNGYFIYAFTQNSN